MSEVDWFSLGLNRSGTKRPLARKPPSTAMVSPVMKDDLSEIRKAAGLPPEYKLQMISEDELQRYLHMLRPQDLFLHVVPALVKETFLTQ